mgnify:CR=1 FL=1
MAVLNTFLKNNNFAVTSKLMQQTQFLDQKKSEEILVIKTMVLQHNAVIRYLNRVMESYTLRKV